MTEDELKREVERLRAKSFYVSDMKSVVNKIANIIYDISTEYNNDWMDYKSVSEDLREIARRLPEDDGDHNLKVFIRDDGYMQIGSKTVDPHLSQGEIDKIKDFGSF